jgi:hypothetical protein
MREQGKGSSVHKQKGVSLSGLLIASVLFVLFAVLCFKVLPVLIEFKTIERQMQSVADDPTLRGASRAQLDRAWAMRGAVESMKSISQEQVDFERDGDKVKVSGEYSVKVPLFANVSLWFDFHPSSK